MKITKKARRKFLWCIRRLVDRVQYWKEGKEGKRGSWGNTYIKDMALVLRIWRILKFQKVGRCGRKARKIYGTYRNIGFTYSSPYPVSQHSTI